MSKMTKAELAAELEKKEARLEKLEQERRFEVGQLKGWLESARITIAEQRDEIEELRVSLGSANRTIDHLNNGVTQQAADVAHLQRELTRREDQTLALEAEQYQYLHTMELLLRRTKLGQAE